MARPRWQGSLAPRVRSRTRGQPSTMQPIDQHDESPIRTAQTDSPAVPAASSTPAVRTSATAGAPEVAARIVADCAAGVALSEITGRLHVTPREALAVLAAVGRGAVGDAGAPVVAEPVVASGPVALMALRVIGGAQASGSGRPGCSVRRGDPAARSNPGVGVGDTGAGCGGAAPCRPVGRFHISSDPC